MELCHTSRYDKSYFFLAFLFLAKMFTHYWSKKLKRAMKKPWKRAIAK